MPEIENLKLYNLQEVAEILGIHYQTVRKLIQNGELKAKKIGKGYIVTSENLKQYVSNND